MEGSAKLCTKIFNTDVGGNVQNCHHYCSKQLSLSECVAIPKIQAPFRTKAKLLECVEDGCYGDADIHALLQQMLHNHRFELMFNVLY